MKNFIFKSDADFHKILFNKLDTLQKNVLYITYHLDKCLVILRKQEVDAGVQKQVDDFYDETSPQTDTDDKEPD